jgi:hypothetical protein
MGAKAPSIPKYNPPTPPAYQPLDISSVQNAAVGASQAAFNLSDYEFETQPQTAPLYQAQQNFLKQMQSDVSGQTPLPAQVQNQMMTAGLQQAGQAMGATGAFGTGAAVGAETGATAGQSAVARNFGLNVANYLQQQKQQGIAEMALGTSMMPRRDYGIGPQGVAQAMINENTNRNNYNWGVYGAQVQGAQFQANLAAQQAGLGASAANANTGATMGLAGSAIGAAGAAASAAAL